MCKMFLETIIQISQAMYTLYMCVCECLYVCIHIYAYIISEVRTYGV